MTEKLSAAWSRLSGSGKISLVVLLAILFCGGVLFSVTGQGIPPDLTIGEDTDGDHFVLLNWGDPVLTDPDDPQCSLPVGPASDWITSARMNGGRISTHPCAWHGTDPGAELVLTLDRALMPDRCALIVDLQGAPDAIFRLYLSDGSDREGLELEPNLLTGHSDLIRRCIGLDLSDAPSHNRLHLQVVSGAVIVHTTALHGLKTETGSAQSRGAGSHKSPSHNSKPTVPELLAQSRNLRDDQAADYPTLRQARCELALTLNDRMNTGAAQPSASQWKALTETGLAADLPRDLRRQLAQRLRTQHPPAILSGPETCEIAHALRALDVPTGRAYLKTLFADAGAWTALSPRALAELAMLAGHNDTIEFLGSSDILPAALLPQLAQRWESAYQAGSLDYPALKHAALACFYALRVDASRHWANRAGTQLLARTDLQVGDLQDFAEFLYRVRKTGKDRGHPHYAQALQTLLQQPHEPLTDSDLQALARPLGTHADRAHLYGVLIDPAGLPRQAIAKLLTQAHRLYGDLPAWQAQIHQHHVAAKGTDSEALWIVADSYVRSLRGGRERKSIRILGLQEAHRLRGGSQVGQRLRGEQLACFHDRPDLALRYLKEHDPEDPLIPQYKQAEHRRQIRQARRQFQRRQHREDALAAYQSRVSSSSRATH